MSNPGPLQDRIAFAKVDPILQGLLPYVSLYKEIVEGWNDHSQDEDFITNIKFQIQLLQELEATFRELGPTFAPSLLLMTKYVALPLTAIFHIGSPPTSSDVPSESTRHQVQASYISNLYKTTADCMKVYVRLIACHEQATDSKEDIPTDMIPPTLCIGFLVAITKGVSLLQQFPSSFDHCEPSFSAIHQAMSVILPNIPPRDLRDALGGNLVAQLISGVLDLVQRSEMPDNTQLEALGVLKTLMVHLKEYSDIWQTLFPGSLVALCRRLLNGNKATSVSVKVEGLCLECIQLLLEITLTPAVNSKEQTSFRESPKEWLKSLAAKARKEKEPVDSSKPTLPPSFVDRIQKNAVPLLVVVLKQTLVKPLLIQKQAVQLCRLILVDTHSCWGETSLIEVSLECCLVFQKQSDETSALATSTLSEIREQIRTEDALTQVVLAKIRSLIQQLPVLVLGSKSLETKLHLQLLTGYLEAIGKKGSSALAATSFSYKPLIQLMEVDIPSINKRGAAIRPVGDNQVPSQLAMKHLSEENTTLAQQMLRTLGLALGVKRGSLAVDALIADCLESVEGNASETSISEWSGSVVVAREILVGVMDIRTKPNSSGKRNSASFSLASAILPPLSNSVSTFCSPSAWSDIPKRKQDAISAIVILYLELLTQTALLVGTSVADMLPVILFPLVEAASSQVLGDLVQNVARDCIDIVSKVCEFESLDRFMQRQTRLLMPVVLKQLRLPGGVEGLGHSRLHETISVCSSVSWILERFESKSVMNEAEMEQTRSSVHQVCRIILRRLDSLSLGKLLLESHILETLRFYRSLFHFWRCSFIGEKKQAGVKESQQEEPWLDILVSFHKPSAEGFQLPKKTNEESKAGASCDSNDRVNEDEMQLIAEILFRLRYMLSNISLKVQVATCDVLAVGFALLATVGSYEDETTEDTTVRNAILRQVAETWPSVKARIHAISDQAMDMKTVSTLIVIQSPHEAKVGRNNSSERLLLARLYTLVASMCECSGDFLATRYVQTVWPLQSKQFGHLMSQQRLSIDSGYHIEEVSFGSEVLTPLNPYESVQKSSPWNDTERLLLLSILKCFFRVVSSDSGSHLAPVLEPTGSMLLPLLGDMDDEISSCAEIAIKSILTRNCDILMRPLAHLSGEDIPSSPYSMSPGGHTAENLANLGMGASKLSRKCSDILQYIDNLPEQIIG